MALRLTDRYFDQPSFERLCQRPESSSWTTRTSGCAHKIQNGSALAETTPRRANGLSRLNSCLERGPGATPEPSVALQRRTSDRRLRWPLRRRSLASSAAGRSCPAGSGGVRCGI